LDISGSWTVFGLALDDVIGEVDVQPSTEMGLAQYEGMIKALAADGADDPLDEGVLPVRSGAVSTGRIPMVLTHRVKASP
jgi:hypothetical protein